MALCPAAWQRTFWTRPGRCRDGRRGAGDTVSRDEELPQRGERVRRGRRVPTPSVRVNLKSHVERVDQATAWEQFAEADYF